MVTEKVETKGKNKDYSASAVKLDNSPLLLSNLQELKALKSRLSALQEQIKTFIPADLQAEVSNLISVIAEAEADLRDTIDEYGSYQDAEKGIYAIKQEKKSLIFKADVLERLYPELAPAFIIKGVDPKMLEAIQKNGRIIDNAGLEAAGALTVDKKYAYIIQV